MRRMTAALLLAAAPALAQQQLPTTVPCPYCIQIPQTPRMPQLVRPVQAPGPTRILSRQAVSGTLRFCQYSDGYVLTVSVASLCPTNL